MSVLLRVVLFSLRVVLLWGAAHYDPPFFNDCRRELPEESLPVAEEPLPVAKKALPVASATAMSNSLFMSPAWLLVSMVRHQQPYGTRLLDSRD